MNYKEIDGFLYSSRFTGNENYAIFDRAISKLTADVPSQLLIKHQELPEVIDQYGIRIVFDDPKLIKFQNI